MMEFTFEALPWEQALEKLAPGDQVSALQWMTLLEDADEDMAVEALDALEQQGVALTIEDLPDLPMGGDLALRLRQESQLVASGQLPGGLSETDPLRLYLEELAMTPAAGDVNLLAQQYLEGKNVTDKLVALCLGSVVEQAKTLAGKNVLLLDLIQEGSLGLWQGILNYTGGDFTSHANWWIRQYLHRAIFLQARSGDLGQKLRVGLEDYRDVDQKLLAELGRNPTLEEIAEAMHITAEEAAVYANMMTMARVRQQVDAVMEPKEEEPEEEQQAVEDTAYFQMRQRIQDLLGSLSSEDAELLTLRFGLEGGMPLSPEEAGKKLGLTPQEVVAKEANALAKLRQQG